MRTKGISDAGFERIATVILGQEEQRPTMNYEVIVGNIGTVLETQDSDEAYNTYYEYVEISKSQYGSVAGEDVILFENGDILEEYLGTQNDNEAEEY